MESEHVKHVIILNIEVICQNISSEESDRAATQSMLLIVSYRYFNVVVYVGNDVSVDSVKARVSFMLSVRWGRS